MNKDDDLGLYGAGNAGESDQPAGAVPSMDRPGTASAPSAELQVPVPQAEPQVSAPPADLQHASPSVTIEEQVSIVLEGEVSRAAQRQISEWVADQTAVIGDKLREVEKRDRGQGVTQADYNVGTVITAKDEMRARNSAPRSGPLATTLAIVTPLAAVAAGVSGSYLHSIWQAIIFGITAAVAAICTILSVLMPKLRQR